MTPEKTKLLITAYLIFINVLTFVLFAADKFRAVCQGWRIRESVLYGLSLTGGAFGGMMSMLLFRHKMKKALFKYGMPIAAAVYIIIIFIYFGGYAK